MCMYKNDIKVSSLAHIVLLITQVAYNVLEHKNET